MTRLITNALASGPANWSLEESGQPETEIEHEWFVELNDPQATFKDARREYYEQCEYRFEDHQRGATGTIRARRTDSEKTILTIKRKTDEGSEESNAEVGDVIFHTVRNMATSVHRKCRYFFPVQTTVDGETLNLTWEIDQYYHPDGSIDPVVKIDLEVPRADIPIPSLPFSIHTLHAYSGDGYSDEEKAFLDDFFDRVQHQKR